MTKKNRAGFLYIVQRTFGEQKTKQKKERKEEEEEEEEEEEDEEEEEGEDEDDGGGFEVLLCVGNSCGGNDCGGSGSVIAAPCADCIVL